MTTNSDWQKACFDVIAPREERTADEAQDERTDDQMRPAYAVTMKNKMWPNGKKLDYCFLKSHPGTHTQQRNVARVIKEWERYANIEFILNESESQDATIRITFDPNGNSWSYIGRDIKKRKPPLATMNLGDIGDTEDISEEDKGVILHEFGHTLGLGHEHQSPSRGGTLTLKEDAIIEFFTTDSLLTKKDVKEQILDVYNERDVSNSPEPDLKSIMMYFMPASMNEQNIDIHPNNNLSELDKAYITINYPPNGATNKMGGTVEHALVVAGVEPKRKEEILESYRNGGCDSLRVEFGNRRGKGNRSNNSIVQTRSGRSRSPYTIP